MPDLEFPWGFAITNCYLKNGRTTKKKKEWKRKELGEAKIKV